MARLPYAKATMYLPVKAQLVAPRDALSYLACQWVELPVPLTPPEAWRRMMAQPLPGLGLAMRIRDAISARFGVARIGGFSVVQIAAPKRGDYLDFFLIEHLAPDVMTLTARDTHLDVMICITTEGLRLGITASVIAHRWFGRVYMWPVGPAHRLIVWLMLRRLRQSMN